MTDSSTLLVRPAQEHEFAAVGDLTARAFAAGPYGHLAQSPEREVFERDAGARAVGGALLVAVTAAGQLVGSSTLLRSDSPYARVARLGEAEIRLLSVDSDLQGTGAGAALVAASVEEARGWGVHAVVLDTGSLNVRAQRLYLRMGFERVLERSPAGDQGAGVQSFVYVRALGDGVADRDEAVVARPEAAVAGTEAPVAKAEAGARDDASDRHRGVSA